MMLWLVLCECLDSMSIMTLQIILGSQVNTHKGSAFGSP